MNNAEEVIGEVLVDLDNHHSNYQRYYRYFYGDEDYTAKHIHKEKVELCKIILERLREK